MKKYRLLSLFLLIPMVLSLFSLPAAALEEPELQCTNAVLVDANYGEVLFSKNAYDKAYPASITKVMTALLVMEALEAGQLTPETPITASATATSGLPSNSSTANIKAGEVLSVQELLYCLLLPSANEAANVLAEAVDGTIPDFVAHMNRKAAELGCKGTHFVNPHGLHDDDHYTTAYDISLFMTEALKYDLFRTIIATSSHTVPATNLSKERLFYNTNGLISNLHYSGYVYDKCIGGKTGTTTEAGRCLVAAAESGDTLLISVILGSGPIQVEGYSDLRQGQFTESTKLLKWGFRNFTRVTITKGSEPVDKVAVTLSRQADEVLVKPQGSITRTLPKDLDLDLIQSEITLFSPEVEAPVEEGQVLGTMKLSYEGEVYGTLDLVAVNSVERSELLYKKALFLAFFQETGVQLILAAVFLLAGGTLLYLLVFRKRRRSYARTGTRSRGNYRGGKR
jgi:D-alanyl-D-alanine carboxypeptidase (penicillin-binding protein 5/6)